MKILLFGKNGQLGWELQRSLAPLGELVALSTNSQDLCGDFTDLDGVIKTIRSINPDIIVNAAAYTQVDQAESEIELARSINALAVSVLATEARNCGAWLVHYSTDYVFDGSGEHAWLETDATNPINHYGKTKLEGEDAIRQFGCKHLIFRTSWIYSLRGNNFAKTMLRLAQQRDQLNVINDQFGAPTSAELLADVTSHCIGLVVNRPELGGIYHVAASGVTTWYDYARWVIEFARQHTWTIKVSPEHIQPVPSSAYLTAATRPKNSRLNTDKFTNTFHLALPHWQSGVTRMLTEMSEVFG